MSEKWQPYKYQIFALKHIINCMPGAGALLDMGLGKTVTTLTAIKLLIHRYLSATKVLVIAPKRVAETVWTAERDKWQHLNDLTISRVMGSERQRIKALNTQADIYTISCDNIAWLVANYSTRWPFDMVVIDESSKFKNHASGRFKAIKKILPFTYRRVILTGTPASNSLIDLWAQIYILDEGERLGKNITTYRESLFMPTKVIGPHIFKYEPQNGATAIIKRQISDICISMNAEDYINLPKLIQRTIDLDMPPAMMKAYKKFEREKVMELVDKEITALNAAALSGKLQQFANGFLYDDNKIGQHIHSLKLEAMEEVIEGANGQPVLLFYWFKHDYERLAKRFRIYQPNLLRNEADIKRWNAGLSQLALAHPASTGHGLNLQHGGNIMAWFGPIWSGELVTQALKRLHRPGQKFAVLSHTARCRGTIDDRIIESNQFKISQNKAIIDAVKALIQEYRK